MQTRLAMISFLDSGSERPDNSLPGFGLGHPSNELPSGGYPSHGLPGGGHIATLPVFPFDPTDPGFGKPEGGHPGNELPNAPGHPSGQPIVPGRKFVVKWLACWGLILVPDNSLPETPEPK